MEKKKNNTNSDIEKKRKEIEKLKKELESKKEIFEMLKNGDDIGKVKEKLDFDVELLGFFEQFGKGKHRLIEFYLGGEYEILNGEDLRELVRVKLLEEEKELEEKEIRIENLEYIELQKNAIIKNNKYQKSLNLFTKILAYGVLGQLAYYLNLYLIGLFPKYEAFENVCGVIIILLIIFLVITDLFFYNYNEKIEE